MLSTSEKILQDEEEEFKPLKEGINQAVEAVGVIIKDGMITLQLIIKNV